MERKSISHFQEKNKKQKETVSEEAHILDLDFQGVGKSFGQKLPRSCFISMLEELMKFCLKN